MSGSQAAECPSLFWPKGFYPFCNPISPVKPGPLFHANPDIRRLLRSRPCRKPMVVLLPDASGPGRTLVDGEAIDHKRLSMWVGTYVVFTSAHHPNASQLSP